MQTFAWDRGRGSVGVVGHRIVMIPESESDSTMAPQKTGLIIKFGRMVPPKKLGIAPVNVSAAVGRTNKEK
jgi:hypothetical protein